MNRRLPFLGALAALVVATASLAQPPMAERERKYEDFEKVVAGAKVSEGLFKLHLKDQNLYAEIQTHQLNTPFLCPIAIARGMGMGGYTLNFDEQWVILLKRVGEKVQVIRRNVRFQAKRDAPVAKAVETTYTDSILMALPIRTMNMQRMTVVIDLSQIFMTNFADLPLGQIDQNRSSWHKVKAFPKNVELEVAATFSGGRMFGDDSVIDPRGNTIVLHYGIVELPDSGYIPRLADDRVGHFLSVVKDFTNDSRDTAFMRYVNRWRLERVDGSPWKEGAKLVPPKKKIVFWIEKSVPDEYRAAVREGILEWNKAFEKVGFRDAIEVRQQENEEFEPEDITYSTLRWITTDVGFAMGPSRANPLTGEIIDADIIFDASMVRFYKQDQQLYKSATGLTYDPPSVIEASKKGWMLPMMPLLSPASSEGSWNDKPSSPDDPRAELRARYQAIRQGFCQCAAHKSSELGLAMMALAARANLKPGDKLPDELVLQAIKETVMHEVGHTLGLRHNFKASTMLKNDQLHDLSITRKQGLVGSVMDYNPVNLAPKGVKQGDFFTSTIGPYDYWAIEYAYKPIGGGTEGELAELQKVATRCAEAGLDYGTDEDLMTPDPNVNQWDLGADPMKYGQDRMLLAEELMKGLAERVVEKGEGYQRARVAFTLLLRQYGDAAFLTGQYVAGEYVYRDHRGDANARDPFMPVKTGKQRDALKFLSEHVLTDKPFSFSPELLRKLAADRWLHWGNEHTFFRGVEFPLYERILAVQRVALRTLLANDVMTRLQNSALKADTDGPPLTLAEVFRTVTESVYADLPDAEKAAAAKSSIIRRNLQREYLKRLSELVLRGGGPADARSLARMHLRDIGKRIDQLLGAKQGVVDDTVRAHLEESKEQIAKVLGAGFQVGVP